jgi:hypothetical protein
MIGRSVSAKGKFLRTKAGQQVAAARAEDPSRRNRATAKSWMIAASGQPGWSMKQRALAYSVAGREAGSGWLCPYNGVGVGPSLWPAVTLNGGSECPARPRSPHDPNLLLLLLLFVTATAPYTTSPTLLPFLSARTRAHPPKILLHLQLALDSYRTAYSLPLPAAASLAQHPSTPPTLSPSRRRHIFPRLICSHPTHPTPLS